MRFATRRKEVGENNEIEVKFFAKRRSPDIYDERSYDNRKAHRIHPVIVLKV